MIMFVIGVFMLIISRLPLTKAVLDEERGDVEMDWKTVRGW
jgi:hypothetical protein